MRASPRIRRISPRRWRRTGLIVLIALLPFVLLLPSLATFLAEWVWFQSLGYERVFTTRLTSQALAGAVTGAVVFLFVFVNLRMAQRGVSGGQARGSGAPPADVSRLLRLLTLPAALGLALLFGSGATGLWLDVLRFHHRTPFGVTDPVFGRDVAYYVFTVPVVASATGILMGIAALTLAATVLVYVLRGELLVFGQRVVMGPSPRWHLASLVALLFALTALRVYAVDLPGLLYSPTGALVGPNFADLHARLIGMRIAGFTALAGTALTLWGARGPRFGVTVLLSVALYLGVSVLGIFIYPGIVQRLVVAPNELAKEKPQLVNHIAATRRAWGLDIVATRELTGEATLEEADIRANRATIDNVRLWDRAPLLQTFGQLQEIRTYYDFVSVDDDRYQIDGAYRQVLLSPRELNPASLPTRTFINERLTFTHGMGLTLGPVNQVTAEGLPVLFVKDLPPVSTVSLRVTRPEIYFGELTDSWVFAHTRQQEFDYPSGDDNIFTSYAGRGGVPVRSFLRRLMFAGYFRSVKVLLSSDITNDSRAMYIRNIRERAATGLPFLRFDGDPYLVVDDAGRLRWILDAYTTTSRYPYSRPLADRTNYMRNSVKVVIDAYDGALTAYLADPRDPLALTLAKAFPGIFHPLDEMPADLRVHLRYPEGLFRVQSDLYATYHMDEPETFYHREDQWQKPGAAQPDQASDPFLRHIIMRLPGEPQAEYILMVPFTPRGKDNLASWMVARNDGAHYGQLVVYRLPKQSLVYGPTQIVSRINQDTEISRQISLWDQRGSEVIRGNLLVIPIEESLIYVQPLYLRAEGGAIPELKRVVVAHQDRVVMEETLEAGLARLFGAGIESAAASPASPAGAEAAGTTATTGGPAGGARAAGLSRQASELYRRAIEAQRAGDWARYGDELARLGKVLDELEGVLAARQGADGPTDAGLRAPASSR